MAVPTDHAVAPAVTADTTSQDAAAGRRARRRPPIAGVAMCVALVVVLSATMVGGLRALSGFNDEQERADVLAAARQVAVNITTLDEATADKDVQRLVESTTPEYSAGLAGDRGTFVESLKSGKFKMTGTATEAGVIDITPDTAQVLVSVKANLTRKDSSQPEARDYRLKLTMKLTSGRWLANSVEFVV